MQAHVDRLDHVDLFTRRLGFDVGDRRRGHDRPGVHLAGGVLAEWFGLGPFHRVGNAGAQLLLHLLLECLGQQPRFDQVLLEEIEWVASPPLLHLFASAVELVVVVRGVGVVAVGAGFDEGRSFTRTCPLGGAVGGVVDGERIVAVDEHSFEAVSDGTVGDDAADLFGLGYRDGVLVVLDEHDQGKLPDACEVHHLVPVALRCRTLAAVHDHHTTGVVHLLCVGNAGGMRILRGDGRRVTEHVPGGIRPVSRHLPSTAGHVRTTGEDGQEVVVRGESPGKCDTDVPVVGKRPVDRRVERECGGNLGRFVPGRGHDERRPALSVESPRAIVHDACEQHLSEQVEHLLIAHSEVDVAVLDLPYYQFH